MNKKLIVASITGVLLSSAIHAGTRTDGFYVKGSWENFALTNYHTFSLANDNPAIGASLGYKMNQFRLEGQYVYQGDSHWSLNRFGLNGYYDFDNKSIFSPYVGLGVHEAFYNYKHYYKDNGPLLTGTVGVRAYATNNLALDLGYQGIISSPHTSGGNLSLGIAYHFD